MLRWLGVMVALGVLGGCAKEGDSPVYAPVLTAPGSAAVSGPRPSPIEATRASDVAKPIAPTEKDAPDAWFATPLGYKPFELLGASGREAIGMTYSFDVRIRVAPEVRADDLVGTLASAAARTAQGVFYFGGFIEKVVRLDEDRNYELTLVPWASLLSKVAGCAIYAEHDVPSVLKRAMGERSMAAYRMDLRSAYPEMPYFVQYRETELNFLSRLAEHVGIVTFFDQAADGHKLVLVDAPEGFGATDTTIAGASLEGLRLTSHLTSTRFTLRAPTIDPSSVVSEATSASRPHPRQSDLEIYDFEGSVRPGADVAFYARIRAEQQQSASHTLHATVRNRPLHAGQVVSIGEIAPDVDGRYLVTSASFDVRVEKNKSAVSVALEAVPLTSMFRPSRRTAWPTIEGIQVARVIEVAGRRAKVHFPWARGGDGDLWVPLVSLGATPTPGADVVVDFLEGDPGRPMVVGTVAR